MSRTATEEDRQQAGGKIFGYLYELVAAKEAEPDDALISRLIQEYLPTGELTRETIAMNSFILLSAGHETTANMIGLGTLALLENPALLARIRDADDPKVVSGAVEELLRYLTIDIEPTPEATWPSATACTSASVKPSPAPNSRPRCSPCCAGCPPRGRPCRWRRSGSRGDMSIYGVHERPVTWEQP
ncbi:cytochrome P450 [Nonomuraea angiospora]